VDFRRRLWTPLLGNMVGFWTREEGGLALARPCGPKIHLDERRLKVGRTHSTARVKKWFSSVVSLLSTLMSPGWFS
jgi:hypothetical protein